VSLASALERAADALPGEADEIRPANGDPTRLLAALGAEAAARVLGWLLAEEPAAGEELLEAWIEESEGAAPILALRDDALPRDGRKLLRRALHRLRSRGIEAPESAPEPVKAAPPPVEDVFAAALITPLDAFGGRIAFLVEPHPSGGVRIFEIVFEEERGILDVRVYSTGRRKARALLRSLGEGSGSAAVDVDPDALRALVARAAARQPKERPLPASFAGWRSHVAVAPEGTPTPGEAVRAALGESADPGLLDAAAVLMREGRIGPWPPSREQLGRVAERLDAARRSPLVVSGPARREQLEGILGEAAAEAYADGDAAERAAERFREAAYVFWKRGQEGEARACLAAAAACGALPPERNPLARLSFEIPLASFLAAEEEPEPAQESLLVKP
jgi:hypothetical protein